MARHAQTEEHGNVLLLHGTLDLWGQYSRKRHKAAFAASVGHVSATAFTHNALPCNPARTVVHNL